MILAELKAGAKEVFSSIIVFCPDFPPAVQTSAPKKFEQLTSIIDRVSEKMRSDEARQCLRNCLQEVQQAQKSYEDGDRKKGKDLMQRAEEHFKQAFAKKAKAARFVAGLMVPLSTATVASPNETNEGFSFNFRQGSRPELPTGGLYAGVDVSKRRWCFVQSGEADAWFQKAAAQGNVPAKYHMALAADRSGKRTEAFKLLRGAAEKGFPPSEYLMGCVVSDPIESYIWYSLTAPGIEFAGTRQLELQRRLTKEQLA